MEVLIQYNHMFHDAQHMYYILVLSVTLPCSLITDQTNIAGSIEVNGLRIEISAVGLCLGPVSKSDFNRLNILVLSLYAAGFE